MGQRRQRSLGLSPTQLISRPAPRVKSDYLCHAGKEIGSQRPSDWSKGTGPQSKRQSPNSNPVRLHTHTTRSQPKPQCQRPQVSSLLSPQAFFHVRAHPHQASHWSSSQPCAKRQAQRRQVTSCHSHSYPKLESLRSQCWLVVWEPKPQPPTPLDCPLSFSFSTLPCAFVKRHLIFHLVCSGVCSMPSLCWLPSQSQ